MWMGRWWAVRRWRRAASPTLSKIRSKIMAFFLIMLLTAVMVIDCIALILLVLIQLPKKEAGLGLAFGGGAADALFGAGSGNVLTKATKYAAGIFFVVAVILGVAQSKYHRRSETEFQNAVARRAAGGSIALPPTATETAAPTASSTTSSVAPATKETTTPAATTPAVPEATAPAATNSTEAK